MGRANVGAVERIVIVGAGTMGAGIAFVAAHAGYAVDLIEPEPAAQERARQRIAKDAQRAGSDATARIQYYSALQIHTNAVLGIEAVPERLDLKRTVFKQLAASLGPQALLATNTSSLSVSEIAEDVEAEQRAIGLHFFNPPPLMKLVEIVRTDQTADEVVQAACEIVRRMGKTAVVTGDTPGFIVNRVARPFYLQAMRAYEAGVASIEELDWLARGIGFRMGPFELMDLIGIDVNLATSESIYERTGAERLEPVDLQRVLVAQGHLGRKTGRGFYDYDHGPPAHDDGAPSPAATANSDERVVVTGFAALAYEMRDALAAHYENVEQLENDEGIEHIDPTTTIVFDAGDGRNDRSHFIEKLDALLGPESVIFADAYATGIDRLANRLLHPERVVAYGILGTLARQRVIEIVDAQTTADDALELAQEFFESIGSRVALVEDRAGLFLGRLVGSIVNEAVFAVAEGVATAEDVDVAMQLGTNYPVGPLTWGREIGGARIGRILQALAHAEGAAFGPHRALWVLDVDQAEQEGNGFESGS